MCQLVAQAVKALSNTHGATSCYNELIRELWSLNQALEAVQEFVEENPNSVSMASLEAVLGQCRRCLMLNLMDLEKYAKRLGSSRRSITDAFWKLRYQSHEGGINRFRHAVASYAASLNLLLTKAGMYVRV